MKIFSGLLWDSQEIYPKTEDTSISLPSTFRLRVYLKVRDKMHSKPNTIKLIVASSCLTKSMIKDLPTKTLKIQSTVRN